VQINNMDQAAALERLGEHRSALNVKPFRGYSQDPNGWAREYDVTMKQCSTRLVLYLRDAAATWYEANVANIQQWDVDALNPQRNQASALVDHFRSAPNYAVAPRTRPAYAEGGRNSRAVCTGHVNPSEEGRP
jgi:hypothetical protein